LTVIYLFITFLQTPPTIPVCRRSTRNIVEDYGYLATQFIQAAAMSVVVGLVYFNLATDQSSMRDRFGMMYILGALYPYMVVLDLIGVCTYTCTHQRFC